MKKVILLAILGLVSPLFAAYVTLTNPLVSPTPLDPIEKIGEGILTFGLVETSNAMAPAIDKFGEANIQISIELNKLKLKDENIALITGTLLNYFSATYDPTAAGGRPILILRQTTDFPAWGDANITIPVEVTANAASTDNSLNGFNANISANDGDTTADGSAAAFTYTANLIDAMNDNGGPVNGAAGATAIGNIISNDIFNGVVPILGANVSILTVTDDTPLVVNATTGEVTVPAGTAADVYTEIYTLCEIAKPSNCDDANIVVTVTEAPIDALNDSVSSFDGVAGGTAIADITDNDTLNGVAMVPGDVNITTVTNDTPLVVNIATGAVTVPANTPAATYVETYTICENLNPTNCDTATITVDVTDVVPDYIPTLNAQGTIITGTNGALDIVIRIGEFLGGENNQGDLMFSIIKNDNLVLEFDPNEMMRQNQMVENTMWELRHTSALYIFTYKANGKMFPKASASKIGLSGMFNSPSSAKGAFGLDVTIVGGTGEDNLGNNKDTDVLEYNNL